MTCFAIGELFAKLLKRRLRIAEKQGLETESATETVRSVWLVTPASSFIRRTVAA